MSKGSTLTACGRATFDRATEPGMMETEAREDIIRPGLLPCGEHGVWGRAPAVGVQGLVPAGCGQSPRSFLLTNTSGNLSFTYIYTYTPKEKAS